MRNFYNKVHDQNNLLYFPLNLHFSMSVHAWFESQEQYSIGNLLASLWHFLEVWEQKLSQKNKPQSNKVIYNFYLQLIKIKN